MAKKGPKWVQPLLPALHTLPSAEAMPLIAKATGGRVICEFSGGKDSVGLYLAMREHFPEIAIVFFYIFPGLRVQEEALDYYERKWGQRIIRVPHPLFFDYLRRAAWMPWHQRIAVARWDNPDYEFNDILREVKVDLGWAPDVPAAIGVRAVDSVFRRWTVGKFGAYNPNHNIIYGIYDWTQPQLIEKLIQTQTALAADYRMMGRSFDGLDFRFLAPLKQYYPDDYERVRAFFPHIDSELIRYQIARDHANAALYKPGLGSAKPSAFFAPSSPKSKSSKPLAK